MDSGSTTTSTSKRVPSFIGLVNRPVEVRCPVVTSTRKTRHNPCRASPGTDFVRNRAEQAECVKISGGVPRFRVKSHRLLRRCRSAFCGESNLLAIMGSVCLKTMTRARVTIGCAHRLRIEKISKVKAKDIRFCRNLSASSNLAHL